MNVHHYKGKKRTRSFFEKNVLAQNWAKWAQFGLNQFFFGHFLEFESLVFAYYDRQAGSGGLSAEKHFSAQIWAI